MLVLNPQICGHIRKGDHRHTKLRCNRCCIWRSYEVLPHKMGELSCSSFYFWCNCNFNVVIYILCSTKTPWFGIVFTNTVFYELCAPKCQQLYNSNSRAMLIYIIWESVFFPSQVPLISVKWRLTHRKVFANLNIINEGTGGRKV